MKKTKIILGLLLVGILLVTGVVFAEKPDLTPQAATVSPSGGHANVIIPKHAIEVAPDVFSIGVAQDVDGKIVEGFLFVNNKKENVKPPWAGGGKNKSESKCYKFMAKGAEWKITEKYVVGNGIDAVLTETSLETWDSEVPFDIFGERDTATTTDGADENSPDGKNEVEFKNLGPSNTIAYTIVWGIFYGPPEQRELLEWDVVFNSAYSYGDAGPTNEEGLGDIDIMDYQNIATHEFGHALGLGHPNDNCTEETMYRFADYGETKKRTLGEGDVAGVNELYQ